VHELSGQIQRVCQKKKKMTETLTGNDECVMADSMLQIGQNRVLTSSWFKHVLLSYALNIFQIMSGLCDALVR
jgi:hypothetical protein